MAKRLTLSDLDFSRAGNTPDWATQLRLDYENQQNKEREVAAQVDAIVKDYESRGEPLRDSEIASLFQAMSNGEDWVRPASADFSNVESGSTSSPPTDPNSWEGRKNWLSGQMREVGALVDTAQAGLQDALAGGAIKAADNPEQIKTLLRATPGTSSLSGLADIVLPTTNDEKAKWLDASDSFAAAAQANRDLADPIKEEAMARGNEAWRQYVETAFDVAGSPSSAASLIGGPAAAIPFADVYLREYGAARREGLDPTQADIAAMAQAVPEGVISAIPSGKLVGGIAKRVPGVRNVVSKASSKLTDSLETRMGQALNTAVRATTGAVGEGLEEGVTFMAQDAARRAQSLVGPEKAREYALEQVVSSDEYMAELWRNARAGAAMGGPVGAVQGAITGAAEGARISAGREADLDTSINTNLGNELLRQRTDADLADLKTDTTLNQDIALEEQRIADEEAKQQAFEQAEKAAAEQRELEEEAGFQTLERDKDLPASRVERYADVVERVPVNPPAEVTPERVAEQRAAEQRAADEQAERVKQGKLAEELRKRREAAQKKADSEQKKQTRAQRLAEKKRRDFIADQVLSENPDATEAELTEEYERRLADETIQPPEKAATKPEPTLEDRVQKVRDNLERAQKGKVSRMQTERIKAVVRRNPDLSVEDIANQLRQEGQVGVVPDAEPIVPARDNKPAPANVIPAPTKSDKSQTEQDFDNFADKIGLSLGMAAEPTEGSTTSTIEAFKPKAKTFIKALVGRTSKDSRDVQTLIHQGKIIVAPNATVLGRPEGNRQAEYDMDTGKMYLYLDNMADLNDPVGHIAAALHETNHALLTEGEIGAAAGKIRTAANKGNKLAQAAVRKAQADTDARAGDTTFENEEVVAYFASETKAAEGKPLGSVGAVVRDLTSAAKGAIRKYTGLDLNVSIGEVATALNAALGDATTREITGRGTGGSLGMIYNMSSKGAMDAVRNGWVYDSVDGRSKYVLSDADAALVPGAKAQLRDTTSPPKLGDILTHDILYREQPDARNITLYVVDAIPGHPTAFGQYDPNDESIWLTKRAVNSPDRELVENILHEVQHHVQHKGGYLETEAYLDSPEITTVRENFERLNREQQTAARTLLDTVPAEAGKQLSAREKREMSDIVFDRELKDVVKASQLSDLLSELQVELDGPAGEAIAAYASARVARNGAIAEYNNAITAAHDDYLANITEREAFRTQGDTQLTEEEVRARGNPEVQMREQSTATNPRTAGRIDVPTRSFEERAREAAGTSLGMAADTTDFPNQLSKRTVAELSAQEDQLRYEYISGGLKDEALKNRLDDVAMARRRAEQKERDAKSQNVVNPIFGNMQSIPVGTTIVATHGFTYSEPTKAKVTGTKMTKLADGWYNLPVVDFGDGKSRTLPPDNIKEVMAPRSLGMAASQTPEAKAVRRDPTVVKWQTWARNLFQNSKGLGPEMLEAFEHAKSSPAGEEARANNSLGKYNAALRQLAKQRGVTMEALNDQIMKELDAIDNQTNGYDANIAAYKAVVGKYGEAGQHLLNLRNQVDALTKEMLRQRAAANVKPTAAETKQLTTLVNNAGRYSHRLYAAYQGKAGKKYANAIMDVYNKGRKGKKLTPAQQDTYDMVERALKTLIDDNLMIPDDAGLAEMGGDELVRLYKTWGKHLTSAISLDGMRDELAERRDSINGDSDRLRVMAEEIASDLLDLTNADKPVAVYYRGSKQDRGILQERAKIPANLRALMGEITDPGTRLLATVAKQAEFVARTKFLLEVKDNIDPSHLQPADAGGTPAVVNNAMQKLEGEGYGPLNGWYASPQLRSMLSDVRESLANFEQVTAMAGTDPGKLTNAAVDKILEKWMKVAGWSKRAQIVGNLFLQPLNWAGATMMPLVNGNLNPATYGRGLQDAVNLIRYARNPSLGLRSASDAVTYGITDSATIGELKGLPYEKIQDFARAMAGKSPSKALRFIKEAGLTLQEAYAMMDVWAKIANFHNEVNQLTSYYKKNGETRTEEQIKREAANITNRTNITYKRAVPVIKALERGGFTNFGTYFYEVFRSQIGNFAQGMQEMTQGVANATTPAAKAAKLQRGMTRVGGQAAYWYAAAYVSSLLSSLMFGDDDDEWDKRALYPEYMQNQDLYTVGYDENGVPVVFSVSRVDAVGPATDIMRQAMIGGMSMEQAKDEVLNLYVRPRIVPQMYNLGKTLWNNTAPTKEPVIQHLTPTGYEYLLKGTRAVGIEDKSTKAWTNLVEAAFGPGTYMAYRESNPTPVAPAEGGDGVQQMALIAKYMGATFTKPDPNSAVFFANKDYEDTIKIGRKDLANAFKDRPNITASEISSFVDEAIEAERAEWNKLARVYRGMEAHGMRDADINKVLKDARLDAGTIRSLKQQKFDPSVVSKRSFEQQINRELSKLSDEDKKAFKANWEKAWKRLEAASKEDRQ